MKRFDKRKTYPDTSPQSSAEVLNVIIPQRVGGVIKTKGIANVPLNIASGRVTYPSSWKIIAQRMNSQGTSKQFGSDYKEGATS